MPWYHSRKGEVSTDLMRTCFDLVQYLLWSGWFSVCISYLTHILLSRSDLFHLFAFHWIIILWPHSDLLLSHLSLHWTCGYLGLLLQSTQSFELVEDLPVFIFYVFIFLLVLILSCWIHLHLFLYHNFFILLLKELLIRFWNLSLWGILMVQVQFIFIAFSRFLLYVWCLVAFTVFNPWMWRMEINYAIFRRILLNELPLSADDVVGSNHFRFWAVV